MEKIGYADRSSLFLQEGLIDYPKVKCGLEKVKYGLREEVEANSDFIQPIAIAAIISEDGGKILCVKKKNVSVKTMLVYQYIIYKCLGTVKPPSFHLSFPRRIEHFVQYNVGSLICKISTLPRK